jgi:isoleucyl-tRNA synthetase
VDHLRDLFTQKGADAWWTLPISELLPADLLAKLGKGVPEDYERGNDILDIWFDSGVSWASVLKGRQAFGWNLILDQDI